MSAGSVAPARRLGWQVSALPDRSLGVAAETWDELLARLWGSHPMLASAFVDALLAHFGSGREHLCIGTDAAGTPQAMAIVVRMGAGRWCSFMPSQAQIGPTLARGPDDVAGLVQALPGHALQVDLMCNDSRFGDLTSCAPSPNSTWHALTTAIVLDGGFDAYWAGRSSQLRKNIRRYEKKATERGEVRTAIHTTPEAVRDALLRYGHLEAAGWKGDTGTAVAPGNQQFDFYSAWLSRLAACNQTEVHELLLDSAVIASRLVVVQGSMLIVLKKTYDERFAQCSPGNLQLERMLHDFFERHAGNRVEFYTNATPEQEAWSTETRAIRHVSLIRYTRWREATYAVRALSARIRGARGRSHAAPQRPLSVERHATPDTLPLDARRLLDEAEALHGLQVGCDWFRNLCRTVPPLGENASFEVLRRADKAIAVLPLTRRPAGAGKPTGLTSLGNFYTSLYAPAIDRSVTHGELVHLLRAATDAAGRPTELDFSPMDPHSREYTLLRSALVGGGFVVAPYFCFGNWTLPRPASVQAYLAERPGSVRSTLKRMGRRFDMAGGRIDILADDDGISRGLEAYRQVYASSWKRPEPFADFVPGLMAMAAARGWLRLGLAWLGEQPIAAQLWMVAHGRAEIFKLAYDEKFKAYSPGTLLTEALFAQVLQDPQIARVDYLTGDDAYKCDWMTRRNERWGLVAYDPATLTGQTQLARMGIVGAVRWISALVRP